MKDSLLIPQERDNYCICSVLQAIFRSYGVDISQEEVANNLTPSENGFFVDDERMKEFMSRQGFDYSYYPRNATPFNEPDMILSEMSDHSGFVGIGSHFYLLASFEDPELTLIDPNYDSKIKRDLYETLTEMKKGKGCFGLIKKLN